MADVGLDATDAGARVRTVIDSEGGNLLRFADLQICKWANGQMGRWAILHI